MLSFARLDKHSDIREVVFMLTYSFQNAHGDLSKCSYWSTFAGFALLQRVVWHAACGGHPTDSLTHICIWCAKLASPMGVAILIQQRHVSTAVHAPLLVCQLKTQLSELPVVCLNVVICICRLLFQGWALTLQLPWSELAAKAEAGRGRALKHLLMWTWLTQRSLSASTAPNQGEHPLPTPSHGAPWTSSVAPLFTTINDRCHALDLFVTWG